MGRPCSTETLDCCAIDFGTSNSAIALVAAAGARLVELEAGQPNMPTAVFYSVEGLAPHEQAGRLFGRAALAAYVEGHEGRLMRSMKSVLGSNLADQSTEVGPGRSVHYLDVVGAYLAQLKATAERDAGRSIDRVVLGRPVFFVDDDPQRDASAQAALEHAAREIGFREVQFQFEPIAAALDHERSVAREQVVLVADLGGGTSDFSLVRVGPQRRDRVDRRDDILANFGVHVAGTDFDRHIELARILPHCGYRARGPARPDRNAREVPSKVYFDLATWHLINTVYAPARVSELRAMRGFYAEPSLHERLMMVVDRRLGHALAAFAEQAKIAVAGGGSAPIDLDALAPGLRATLSAAQARQAIDADLQRIVSAVDETMRRGGLKPAQIDALYFTGGSTGLDALVSLIASRCPQSAVVRGERFASVAQGLGLFAQRLFGADAIDAGRY